MSINTVIPSSASPISGYVFVYGTLRRGQVNDITRLDPAVRFVALAHVDGWLFDMGWYPGLRLAAHSRHGAQVDGDRSPDSQPVVGEVFAIPSHLVATLDHIEEVNDTPHSEYFKRQIAVRCAGTSCEDLTASQTLDCLCYEINPHQLDGKRVIESGDWVTYWQTKSALSPHRLPQR